MQSGNIGDSALAQLCLRATSVSHSAAYTSNTRNDVPQSRIVVSGGCRRQKSYGLLREWDAAPICLFPTGMMKLHNMQVPSGEIHFDQKPQTRFSQPIHGC